MEGAAPRLDRLERQERASTIGATRRLTRPVQSITQAAVQGADLTRGETPSILLSVRVCGVARPSVESARETEAEIEAAAKRHTTVERRWTLALSSVFLLGQCGRQIDGFLFIESDSVTHHQCVRFNQSTPEPPINQNRQAPVVGSSSCRKGNASTTPPARRPRRSPTAAAGAGRAGACGRRLQAAAPGLAAGAADAAARAGAHA